jgi:electron transfer flavoprotein alpha subunit
MTKVLVFGTVVDGAMASGSLEAVGAARGFSAASISGALLGHGIGAAAEAFASYAGRVLVVDDARLSTYRAETFAAAASAIVAESKPDLVLFPATAEATEWVPLLAGRLGAALASGCIRFAFDGDTLIATRPVCGGAVLAEYAFQRPLRFATLAPGAFAPAAAQDAGAVAAVAMPDVTTRVDVLEEIPESTGSGPSLRKAKVVVSGGLGLGTRDKWKLVEEAAESLGAAVGATRAVVELGWVPSAQQVGFSGQKISPDLYVAVGISGAVHHLAGLAGAKTIVAINKDAEAGIFRAARFGVVGDANEVVPAFVARVKELRAGRG